MKHPTNKKQLIFFGFIGAIITILLSSIFSNIFEELEWKTLDIRFVIRGPINSDSNLVLIDADDSSAEVYGSWPWKRSIQARMIKFLKDAKTKSLAYDILFAHEGEIDEDLELAKAVDSFKNLVFPIAVTLDSRPNTKNETMNFKFIIPTSTATENYFHVSSFIIPMPKLIEKLRNLGHIATNRDSDGIVRRVPLFVKLQGNLIPSLAFQAVLKYLGIPISDIEIKKYRVILHSEHKNIIIPIDSKGQMIINYAGRWSETFKHSSFAEILSQTDRSDKFEDIKGKFILVANTMTGTDIKSVPFEKDFPGPGIHANIINTILTGNFLKETHQSTNHSLILIFCIVTALIFKNRKYLIQTGYVFALVTLYCLISIIMFSAGIILPIVTPLMGVFLTNLLLVSYKAGVEKTGLDKLGEEKIKTETHLDSIIKILNKKNQELDGIRKKIDEIQNSILESNKSEREQEQTINNLEKNVRTILNEREKLQAERDELQNKVLDLRVHITFDQPANEALGLLVKECRRHAIITKNELMLELFKNLKQIASVPSPLLITGESGTGKELFAKAVHVMSLRKGKFIALNMGAIPEALTESELFGHKKGSFTGAYEARSGKFKEADEGTVFLDEIGESSKEIQVKLLRAIQEKEIQPIGGETVKANFRVVAATNKNLEKEVKENRFREDLLFRLNALTLEIPPLRKRKEDLEILAHYFIQKYSDEYGKRIQGLSDKAMQSLKEYDWPGNIRELENIIQRGITFARGELIQEKDFKLNANQSSKQPIKDDAFSLSSEGDRLLLRALKNNNFEVHATAVQLSMNRNTVSSRLKGICFDFMVKNRMSSEEIVFEILGKEGPTQIVHQKINEYYENLIRSAKKYDSEGEAIKEIIKKSKNVPVKHHRSIEILVKNYFQEKNDDAKNL